MQPTSAKSDLNLLLKLKIIATRQRQGAIARRARIGEVRFSKIVTCRIAPTPKEKQRIAKALNCDQSEIFEATS